MNVPSISHPTDRPNFTVAYVNGVTIWFSYRTPVAFQTDGRSIVRENDWSTTTGKHLNYIDGGTPEAKKARVSGEEFERLLSAAGGDVS